MRRKKEKGHWEKRTERFSDGAAARSRAGSLRSHKRVTHVHVDKEGADYVVSYSVAKSYLEELMKSGIKP
jgi:hypothetical protein